MVGAGNVLFLAGPPDVANEENTYSYVFGVDDKLNREFQRQASAWEGAEGGLILAVEKNKGIVLGKWDIPHVPVWDGMIAAYGRLYIAMKDGTLLCLGKKP